MSRSSIGIAQPRSDFLGALSLRTLIGIVLVAVGATQLLLATGLVGVRLADLWPVGVIVLGLWLVVSGFQRSSRAGVTVGIVGLGVAIYQLGWQHFAWPAGLYLPVILIALGLGVLVTSNFQLKIA